MADLYRKSSLEKLSNPEQLDRMIKISSPMSWLALIAVFLVILATVIWSIVGTLPTTETVSGMIVDPHHVNSVYADMNGTLEKYCVDTGKNVKTGEKIAEIKHTDGSILEVKADKDGVLSIHSLEIGAPVLAGTEIARITPQDLGAQVIVCYVPLAHAQKYEKGMSVLVYPTSIDSKKYGHMEAEIVSVDAYAANTNSLVYVLGSGNMVAEQFASGGPIVSIVCKIKTDKETKSGYYWSSDSAKDLTVSNGTVISAKIVVEECAPITKLFGKIKDAVGD